MQQHPLRRQFRASSCFLLLAILALPATTHLSAAEHPIFTGTWKLDKPSSDFGALPGPTDLVDVMDQQAAEIVVKRNRDGQQVEVHIPLDGSEKSNTMMGSALKTTAHWDGPVLMVSSAGTARGAAVSFQEKWTLSPDGKTLKVARHLVSPRGETDQTVVMLRQDGTKP